MNREITFAQLLVVTSFGLLMFFAGYEFHRYAVKPQSTVQAAPQATASSSKPSPAARPFTASSDSNYDESGSRGTDDVADRDTKPVAPKAISKTVALMPGQSFNAPRGHFRKIEVRSDYPVEVASGPCHQTFTVDFFCDSDPADFFVRDTRRTPLFATPKANNVTVTVIEF